MSKNREKWKPLDTLYIGGGTPSLWGERGADFLKNFLQQRGVELSAIPEVTLEVNPGSWTEEDLQAWRDFGVNRFSLGIQALDSFFLKTLDRVHSLDDVYETLEYFHTQKWNFSIDFMLGLPFSEKKKRSIQNELNELAGYNFKHVSLYILTTSQDYIHRSSLPSEDWVADEYLAVSHFLKKKDFQHYEVSNFSLEGFESQHNLAYWRGQSVAALGPSATGYFSQGLRYKWLVTKPQFTSETLNDEEKKLEALYLGLRTKWGIAKKDYVSEANKLHWETLEESWRQRGLLESFSENHIQLNERGFLQLDGLINEIFSLEIRL